jgi:phosphatidylserine/phosphatidylglycerophosphate/cardiolipin synthase-like enzyme
MKYFVDYLPITTGNDLRLYIDGENYCADLYADLRAAKKFVFLTGLHFMADFRLIRKGAATDATTRLASVLQELGFNGVAVYLLVNQFWKDESEVTGGKTAPIRKKIMKAGEIHGYLPETLRLFQELRRSVYTHCRTDIHPNSDIFATHHQKTVVIDDKVAFLGGIDLTFLDGDRWDTHDHKPDQRAVDRTQKFWHDVHLRVEGPAVLFVRDNFIQRWKYGNLHSIRGAGTYKGHQWIPATPDRDPPALPVFSAQPKSKYQYPTGKESPEVPTVQIVRSMPHKNNWHSEKPVWHKGSDDWERSCKQAYLTGIRAAKEYIYLENQWVADEDIWAELVAAAKRNNTNPTFRIIVMVPYEGLFAAGLGSNQELWIGSEIKDVIKASYNTETFGMYSLVRRWNADGRPDQIYIHSKILIVDDEWTLIGSANAGGISLEGVRTGRDEPDTELSAIILDKKFASNFRKTLWEEHLGIPVSANYVASDADTFRIQAEKTTGTWPQKWRTVYKVLFFPGYENIKKGYTSPGKPTLPEGFFIEQFRPYSRIVPSYPDRFGAGIPLTLIRAAFRAQVVPSPPAGYRCWYRWKCELFDVPSSGFESERAEVGFRMRGLKYDDERPLVEYSDQDSAYIGRKTAEAIDTRIKDVARGRILCRVQIIPMHQQPDKYNDSQTFLLQYECDFMNAEFAKNNHPDFVEYKHTHRRRGTL